MNPAFPVFLVRKESPASLDSTENEERTDSPAHLDSQDNPDSLERKEKSACLVYRARLGSPESLD